MQGGFVDLGVFSDLGGFSDLGVFSDLGGFSDLGVFDGVGVLIFLMVLIFLWTPPICFFSPVDSSENSSNLCSSDSNNSILFAAYGSPISLGNANVQHKRLLILNAGENLISNSFEKFILSVVFSNSVFLYLKLGCPL